MVKDTVPPGDPRVHLQAEVTRVKYDCDGVVVSTRDGQVYKATEVISTLPLGVLQRNHRKIFDPPMPDKQVGDPKNEGGSQLTPPSCVAALAALLSSSAGHQYPLVACQPSTESQG